MFLGADAIVLGTIIYTDADDCARQLREMIPAIRPRIETSARRCRRYRESLRKAAIGRQVLRQRIMSQISRSELASGSGIGDALLYRLECDDTWASLLSLMQLQGLTDVLGSIIAVNGDSPPSTYGSDDDGLNSSESQSLDHMVDFIREEESHENPLFLEDPYLRDTKILGLWSDYRHQATTAVFGRDPLSQLYGVDAWRRLYASTLI